MLLDPNLPPDDFSFFFYSPTRIKIKAPGRLCVIPHYCRHCASENENETPDVVAVLRAKTFLLTCESNNLGKPLACSKMSQTLLTGGQTALGK